jgi:hypothetical protein
MYYRIYGVMSKTGFNTELFQENTQGKGIERLKDIDENLYPFFAITEHVRSGSPAISIMVGRTRDRLPISESSLIKYETNPMLDAALAERLFGKLAELNKGDEVIPEGTKDGN